MGEELILPVSTVDNPVGGFVLAERPGETISRLVRDATGILPASLKDVWYKQPPLDGVFIHVAHRTVAVAPGPIGDLTKILASDESFLCLRGNFKNLSLARIAFNHMTDSELRYASVPYRENSNAFLVSGIARQWVPSLNNGPGGMWPGFVEQCVSPGDRVLVVYEDSAKLAKALLQSGCYFTWLCRSEAHLNKMIGAMKYTQLPLFSGAHS